MAHRKILLFDLTQMLGDLLAGVLADEEVEFVRADEDFVDAVARLRPDVAVVQTQRSEGAIRRLLERPQRVRLLVLAGEGRRAVLYDLDPAGVALLDMSPQSLRAALEIEPRAPA